MELFLVRHAQSQANAGLTRNLDSELTPLGRLQAEATARGLAGHGITRVFVSPLRRTLATVAPICRRIGLRAEVLPDICEYFSPNHPEYRTFPGLSAAEIAAGYPFAGIPADFPRDRPWWPQEFENPATAYARAERTRDLLLARYGKTDEKLLIVSHADPIGWLIEAFLRSGPVIGGPAWTDNCAIAELHIPRFQDPAIVVRQNDTRHLAEVYSEA
ncbi:MAG: histidine phosphatase family protein [Capsulimonadaceae bacterium]